MTSIIVACDHNFVIGTEDNKIPWSLPDDMKFFKETTLNHPIIMGRKTWDSLPRKPLPKRINIVVSRTLPTSSNKDTFTENNPIFVHSIKEALESLSSFPSASSPFIIGGAQIYSSALEENLVEKIIMTRVKKEYTGTVYFPNPANYGFAHSTVIMTHLDFEIVEFTK
jgi:dihydrofolate reductase